VHGPIGGLPSASASPSASFLLYTLLEYNTCHRQRTETVDYVCVISPCDTQACIVYPHST
jgi:hypothetical protein